jgi:hypothetical protein
MTKRTLFWIILLVMIELLTSSSCKSEPLSTPTVRGFSTLDLLIGVSDMPEGWQVWTEPHQFNELGTVDAATISFISGANVSRNLASFAIYNFGTSEEALRVFNKMFVPRVKGNPPVEWVPPGVSAGQDAMGCYDYEGREPLACEWSAQYEEFVVQFNTWLIPGYMSLNQLEKIIMTIDNRMIVHLDD